MFSGMSTYTLVHVVISLIGIVSGLIVAFGLMGGRRMNGTTALFLVTTVLTSVTGFFFPFCFSIKDAIEGAGFTD